MRRSKFGTLPLDQVPPWHTHPVELTALLGSEADNQIAVMHHPELRASCDGAVRELIKQHLKPHEREGVFFDGPYANVESIEICPTGLTINTGATSMFPYLASAWYHRDNPGDNTIRPLAVQTVIYNEDHSAILIEQRPMDIVDHPGKLSVLGGALKPGEDPLAGACRCLSKWGIEMRPDQLKPLALTHEPAGRIYCLVFATTMPDDRLSELLRNPADKQTLWLESIADRCPAIHRKLMTTRNIHVWNPLGFAAFACGALAYWGQDEEGVHTFLDKVYLDLTIHKPYQYTFPMQKYLPA